MTEKTTIRNGYDTWVSDGAPTSKHPRDNRLHLKATASPSYAYVYFPLGPELRGNTVTTAPFHWWGRGVFGSTTVTARRITSAWDAGTLTSARPPSVGTTTVTLTQANPADLTEWVLDLATLVQEFASGSRWYGIRLETTSTTDLAFNSLNASGSKPYQEVRWNERPAAPVDLSPAGGRVVSTGRPTLSWSNEDSPDASDFTAFEVQIDPAANSATALTFTGGSVAELDLTQTSYPALANNASTQWRVRVFADGLWSDWSDWVTWKRVDLGTVTITTPGTTVAEFTPPVAWTTSFTQTAWRIIVTDLTTGEEVHNTGRKTGATQDYTIPQKDDATGRRILRDGRDYRLEVRAFDTEDREATASSPSVARAVVVFHYADDPTVNPVTNLSAVQVGMTPYVDLTWQRANPDGSSNTPDSWTITADGRPIDADIPGADLIVSGAYFKYRYKDARPFVEQKFRVKATVNGKTAASPLVSVTPQPAGVWVLGANDVDVLITGKELGSFAMPDRGTTLILPQSRTPVRVSQGVGGWSGTISGRLANAAGFTADEWRDRLLKIKKGGESVTLIAGGESFRAVIFDVNVDPSRDGGQTREVSFEFFQTGAIDWLD